VEEKVGLSLDGDRTVHDEPISSRGGEEITGLFPISVGGAHMIATGGDLHDWCAGPPPELRFPAREFLKGVGPEGDSGLAGRGSSFRSEGGSGDEGEDRCRIPGGCEFFFSWRRAWWSDEW